MNGPLDPKDPIDQAIAAAERPVLQLVEVRVQIASSGRPVILQVPADLHDMEVIELAAFVLLHMRGSIDDMRRSSSRLIVPRST